MKYRKIPKTGDKLSILGFGCMRLPQKKGKPGDGKIDIKRATRQIHSAVDRGINYLDTAMPYHNGNSEPFLGRALAGGYREKVRLATKLPPWLLKNMQDMENLLHAQLHRLSTDRIDYYLLHALEKNSWAKLLQYDVLGFLDRALRDGKIINAGFSFHGDLATFKTIVDAYDWTFCQIQFNYLDQRYQAGIKGLRYAAEKKLGVVVMEPLRGGLLADPVPDEIKALWNSAQIQHTSPEWALRWIWNHPEVTVVLSGMNKEAHIDENIRIADEALPATLTQQEQSLVRRAEQTYRRLMKAGCTGCRYCMPCPSGVNIPECFEIYNYAHMFNDTKTTKLNYVFRLSGATGAAPSYASLCQKCGNCENNCPQNLPIQDLLQDVAITFESKGFKTMQWIIRGFNAFQRWSSLRLAKRKKKALP